MSANREIIERLYAGFAAGDVPAVLGSFDPEISWTEAAGFPYAGTYIGPDAVLQNVFMRLATEWEGFAAVPSQFVSEGDTVVAIGEYSGTFNATGKAMKTPMVHVWTLKDGKIVNFVQHCDTVLVQAALS
jgi:ketosteroid isomerase-like protein